MLRRIIILILFLMSSKMLLAQFTYLDKPELMAMADSCLQSTYNCSFQKARYYQQRLKQISPGHPAPVFLEALIIYWENFPLTPEKPETELFIDLLNQNVDLAEIMQEDELTLLEGTFFELFGRAFKAMFWADNGKSARVIPDLGSMYKLTIQGFTFKEQFNEFYFSTGLYNYYVEAYPEAHPAYKPLVSFMHGGDKDLGLEQLSYAINNTIFLKVESLLFMSLIQLNYENNLELASQYAEQLFKSYPRNSYYQGLLCIILLHLHEYDQVEGILGKKGRRESDYQKMVRLMAEAFLEEMRNREISAKEKYLDTIELADRIGPFANIYKAVGYMGLSRIYERKGLQKEAKQYERRAGNYTSYSFILGE